MATYVFRGDAGQEERHEATDAIAAATVERYASIGFKVRAFRLNSDGSETEVFAAPVVVRDRWADLRTNVRGR